MADGDADEPPYWAARRLLAWAGWNWNDVDGYLLVAGSPGGVEALDVRQLCNVAYVMQTQGLEEREHEKFDRELVASPDRTVSHGVADLMQLMMGGQ